LDFSTEHLLAVAAIAITAAALVASARLRPGAWTRAAGLTLAVVLVGAEVGWWTYLAATGAKDAELGSALPLQLCDAAIFISAIALVLRTQVLVEMTYFWGLAGTIQAVITPDLPQHFPTFPYFQYYVAHGGIVLAALFLVVGLGQWPRRDAVFRVLAITVAYVLLVGVIDAATGADYMYLRGKPQSASLLDLLGPWPWYLAWAALIGVALLLVLDAPFRWLRQRELAREEHS
jgi:hypothetical integral membrane protein (TIGR02206 family)